MNGGKKVTTGIVRRIDELGRIVIPKEIRKNLRIKNGDNIEILVEGDSITLRKYSQIENALDMTNVYNRRHCVVTKFTHSWTYFDFFFLTFYKTISSLHHSLNCFTYIGI